MFRVPDLANLQHVIEAAARVDGAIGGVLQLINDDGTGLHVVAHCGLPDEFIESIAVVRPTDTTSCAQASTERRRVVIRDVQIDPTFAPHRAAAEAAGFRAVQSTPLIDSERRLQGVLSTNFAVPHHPSTGALKEIDLCCRIAVRLIEANQLRDEVAADDRRLGLPLRTLSPGAAHAADSSRMLLTSLGRGGGNALLENVERNLAALVGELTDQFHREGVLARA